MEHDFVARLIRNTRLSENDAEHLLSLSINDIIQYLIGVKGGFVYRAYLLERLLELVDGPRGIAVPESVYSELLQRQSTPQ
ncbi:hypothetical protein [Effusibacillus pohliae]|uniref:hypothetical protein n=1 Tax=Effusibacillus pohliae TaxID=232270 RepID=UPI00037FFEEA|nr:hypothetical protein [Effusibacillus pohliae]